MPGLASLLQADNAINYSQGSVPANGLVTVDNFEPIDTLLGIVTTANYDMGDGDDRLHLER